MRAKAGKNRKPSAPRADDFWPLLVEFALSQRAWWVGLCADFDLTAMQGHALRILDPGRPVAMNTLAEAMTCDASNVTGIVDKLESRGLIARQGSDGDRRVKHLAVTDKGRTLREELCARTMVPPDAVKALSADARRRLAEILAKIVRERGGAADVPKSA